MKELLRNKYVKFWHWKFKLMNINWKDSDLYMDGEYDEIPYTNFEKFVENIESIFSIDTEFWKKEWLFVADLLVGVITWGVFIYLVFTDVRYALVFLSMVAGRKLFWSK